MLKYPTLFRPKKTLSVRQIRSAGHHYLLTLMSSANLLRVKFSLGTFIGVSDVGLKQRALYFG